MLASSQTNTSNGSNTLKKSSSSSSTLPAAANNTSIAAQQFASLSCCLQQQQQQHCLQQPKLEPAHKKRCSLLLTPSATNCFTYFAHMTCHRLAANKSHKMSLAKAPRQLQHCSSSNSLAACSSNSSSRSGSASHHCKSINSCASTWSWSLAALFLLTLFTNVLVEGALRNVNLIVEPPAVRRGQHAILRCQYDLEGAPLYSSKFYRGQLEFYRYTPGELPNTKVFAFPGINVDITNSNATQVLIRNVGFGISGNFSCEVTADAPLFSTATATANMQVVELPEKRPQLFTEHTRYEPGDILRANCSTLPSRPRAELKLTINNIVISNADVQYIRTIDNLIASRISLKLQLQGIHFSSMNPSHMYNGQGQSGFYGNNQMINSINSAPGGLGGSLMLRCTATIGELYQEYKEIELGTPQRDPVPARVTLSSGSGMRNFFSYFTSAAAPTKTGTTDWPRYLLLAASVIAAISAGELCNMLLATMRRLSVFSQHFEAKRLQAMPRIIDVAAKR